MSGVPHNCPPPLCARRRRRQQQPRRREGLPAKEIPHLAQGQVQRREQRRGRVIPRRKEVGLSGWKKLGMYSSK